jgi:hypothetical protein
MIHIMCFKKLLHERVTLAQKFGGALGPGKPIPETTITIASSIVSIYLHNYLAAYVFIYFSSVMPWRK